MKKVGFAMVVLILALDCLSGCKKEGAPPPVTSPPAEGPAAKPAAATRQVQDAVVANQFYPGDPGQLKSMIQTFLNQAGAPPLSGRVLGFMVPHAGYPYSGSVAAYVYQAIKATGKKKFVIMGPAHHVGFQGVYVMDQDAYRTPLGEVKMDRDAARRLAQGRPFISTDDRLYDHEHSVEVQIPFLQAVVGPELAIVVIVIGQITPTLSAQLAQALDQTFPGDDAVFIASSDMAHGNYPPFRSSDQIRPVDTHTLDLVKAVDLEGLAKGLADDTAQLCGGRPVLTLLNLFQTRGGKEGQVLKYADSGDATGDHSKVVGYGAVAFALPPGAAAQAATPTPAPSPATPAGYTLTDEEKKELLKMARACVTAAIKKEKIPEFTTGSAILREPGAAFVTLKNQGELRGCIGSIMAAEPLYLCVQRRAVDAALHDSRFVFNSIQPPELSQLEIEISVLTPLTKIANPSEVVVGRDGVALSLGQYRGVFLPQVPGEQGWDHDQYLSNLCHKAGIADPNCWHDLRATLETFRAIVFSEKEMIGSQK